MGAKTRGAPSPGRIARRRWFVAIAKVLLPMLALALLATIALWQDLTNNSARARFSYRRGGLDGAVGLILEPRYHGVDERNRPYTVTAASGRQNGPERFDLVEPKADVTLENGTWMMVQSRKGVFIQHSNQLDMSGDVTVYRDDGTTMQTAAATVDLKAGAATSAEMVHVEGPFGTLDAQGFAALDRSSVMQFSGPGRLVLNGSKR
jgi:lipopolysaccharide export system protein LptC